MTAQGPQHISQTRHAEVGHLHSADKHAIPLLTVLHTLLIQRSLTGMTSHELNDNAVGIGRVVPVLEINNLRCREVNGIVQDYTQQVKVRAGRGIQKS